MDITIQFPKFYFRGQCELTTESFDNGLITKFSTKDEETIKSLFEILAHSYGIVADELEKSKVNDKDIETKLKFHSGQIWLGDWYFTEVWPQSINFGSCCDTNDSIEVTWRFKEVMTK